MFTVQGLLKFRRFPLSYQVAYKTTSRSFGFTEKLDQQMIEFVNSKQYKQAIKLFKQSKVHTDVSINMALKACTLLKNYEFGKQIEQQLSVRSQQNEFIQSSLLQLYMHCGDMKDAERIYAKIKNISNRVYTILFKGFIMNDQAEKVLDLVDQMKVKPDQYNLTMIFSACAKVKNARAKAIGIKLFDTMSNHFKTDVVLLNAALNMLISIDEIDRAEILFNSIKRKDVVSYGALLKGYVEKDMNEKALNLFEQMHIIPDNIIYTLVFKACAQLNNERAQIIGRQLLAKISTKAHIDNTVWNSAIHMLMQFGNVNDAERIFKSLKNINIVSYGTLMEGYFANGMHEKVLDLFEQMSIDPNNVVYTIVCKACAELKNNRAKTIGMKLFDKLTNVDEMLLATVVHMLMNFGEVDRAEKVFESMLQKNVISYGSMIHGYVENNLNEKALDLFEQIAINQDETILPTVFKACAQLNNERAQVVGRQLLEHIQKQSTINNTTWNSALRMLMKFGDINGAEYFFESLPNKDVISYGIIMSGYIDNDMSEKALNLFEQMEIDRNEVIYTLAFKACAQLNNECAQIIGNQLLNERLNISELGDTTRTSAIHMLGNFGDIISAEQLFESLKTKDAISYGIMMKCYNINRMASKSLKLFKRMKQENITPTPVTFTFLLQACAQIGLPFTARSIINQIPLELHGEIYIANGLINVLGKIGSVDQAYSIFKSVKSPDVYTYNIMMNAYGLNGRGVDAIDLYYQMPYGQWDEISHIAVLNACSHSGLSDQARSIFTKINNKTERIYTTMIDCSSRLQMFDEAEKLIQEYEQLSKQFCLSMYMSVLSGARNARNSVLASKLYKKMQQIFPNEKDGLISASILLSNIYMSIGDDEQASAIRQYRLNNYGRKVTPGEASTEDNDEILIFRAHDRSHPFSDEIHAEAMKISNELRQHGHQFDGSWVTRPLEETETVESVLCSHSERLAIAYHFIRGKKPSNIHVVENLRVCGDCHEATKLIAKIRQCEIFVRDANRMHHFQKNGQCSCNDYF